MQKPMPLRVVAATAPDDSPSDDVPDLQAILGVEECVRYYPPDLHRVDDPAAVFAPEGDPVLAGRRREFDIFVDVPFCKTICGFCPFNVYPYETEMARRYLDDLAREIDVLGGLVDLGGRVGAVWVGGGTPTVMQEDFLDELLTTVETRFELSDAREVTVEIKPALENLTPEKIAVLHAHGIRRISMGIQTTQEHQLKLLGRGHTREEALEVVSLIKDEGFALNVDMMYRLPGQRPDEVLLDLEDVLGRGIDHMSWFPYVPHEGTALARRIDKGRVDPQADRDAYQQMFQTVATGMTDAGFDQYTPYHFGLTDRCHYHVGRWGMPQRETLGLGPGAFSFFNGWIYTNEHDPGTYHDDVTAGRAPVVTGKQLDRAECITRLAVLGVKLFEIDAEEFRAASGVDLASYYADEIALLTSAGLVEFDGRRLVCTPSGRAFNNDVASVFATDTARRTRHPQALDFMRAGS